MIQVLFKRKSLVVVWNLGRGILRTIGVIANEVIDVSMLQLWIMKNFNKRLLI